jgi:hypothetical protein
MTRFRPLARLVVAICALLAALQSQAASAQDIPLETPRFVVFEAFMSPG